jgi:hypothetical protein
MSITLNGTGTITGLLAGGLPDATITSADLASGAVNTQTLTLLNASGSAPVYACRAWINFNGTGTVAIRGSGNVSSITDVSVGHYIVNFTTAMPNANYSAVLSTQENRFAGIAYGLDAAPLLTTSVRVYISEANTGATDMPGILVAVFC